MYKLTSPSSGQTLPLHTSEKELANDFGTFFNSKIERIVNNLDIIPNNCHDETGSGSEPSNDSLATFTEFQQVGEDDVRTMIKNSPSKSCRLDPAPTWLIKKFLNALLPLITRIINASLSSGSFPALFKISHVIPILKKPQLDENIFANYRPIANLPFLSKVMERIVSSQLRNYLQDSELFPAMQSAYRENHSTETALLKVYNDILLALDKGQEAILLLLDYSAAFDTISHERMIRLFRQKYGIGGTVLSWLKSYLVNRKQIIIVNGEVSEEFPLHYGVPQGSVMGPLAFALYAGPLGDVISSHRGVNHMIYADDTQLYITMHRDNTNSVSSLVDCFKDVKTWANNNSLKLNGNKTEMIHIVSQFRKPGESPSLNIDGLVIDPAKSARDLGVIVDSFLDMKEHIRKMCRAASFGIFKIGKIRKFLDQKSTERLVNALVTSHLDYCNSLLIQLPASHLAPLQFIQNTAARLITRTRKYDRITPVILKLHWLKIPQRIQFKILLLTYNVVHNHEPCYLIDLISHKPSRSMTLRSSAKPQLALGPRTRTRYGDRAFSVCAPLLWNNLPSHIQNSPTAASFKSQLKTYLFKQQ